MKTVVILGFSTTGKSSILDYFRENFNNKVDCLDTDSIVSKSYNNHIYNIFLELYETIDPIDRFRPINYIENAEDQLLIELCKDTIKPRLIAAGPFIPIRPNFKKFNDYVKPDYYFLKTDPEKVYQGLMYRHKVQIEKGLDKYSHFGCWDHNVTKVYKNGKYEMLPKDKAIENISRHLDSMQKIYKKLANTNTFYACDLNKHFVFFKQNKYDEFVNKLMISLNINRI